MEPAAPGTEDDVLIVPALLRKKEDQQSRLLSLKANLPNGVYGNVFEHSILNGSDHWYCNLCACPIMGRIFHHEMGKRHSLNMRNAGVISSEFQELDADPEPPLLIAPGEPVPPGFEDNQKVAQIQERLDSFTADPLIGIEYLLEVLEYDQEKEPTYLCILCDKRGDPRTIISHLSSYHHISQYLQRHFITCYRALVPYITKHYKRNWQNTMQKVAEAIEAKYGRLRPHVVEKEVFDTKRNAYQNMISIGPHFAERIGFTFEELINKEELTKVFEDDVVAIKQAEDVVKRNYRKTGTEITEIFKHSPSPPVVAKPKKPKAAAATEERRRSLSSVSSISSSDLSDFEPGQPRKHSKPIEQPPKEQFNRDFNKSKPPFKKQRINLTHENKKFEPRPVFTNMGRNDRRPILPWQRADYRSREENPVPERPKTKVDKHTEFKKLATAIEKDMDRILKQHEKNPEKHPQYNDEWKKFWNQRYKELQAEGKNPAGHDFKPEWIEYWNKRLKDLHSTEVKSKKDALRKRLGIPEEPASICFRITGRKKPGQKDDLYDSKVAPMASAPDQDPDVIVIDDKEATSDERNSKRSRSPWERESHKLSRISHDSRSRSKDRSHSRSRRSRNRSVSHNQNRSRSRNRLRSLSRSRSRSIDRNHRSHSRRNHSFRSRSREREIEWPPSRDPYHEYTREKMYYRNEYPLEYPLNYIKPPWVMRDVTRHPVASPPAVGPVEPEPEPEDDGVVNLVSVLRILTALEEKLGSLGPKIIDLLSQALAMEKSEANSSESLLDNDMNCVMFETVKEKLKGQMLAGLVNHAQEKAFKIAIKKIASLIHLAGERKKESEKGKPKIDPIQVPGVGTVDKAAIAKQIAAALIVQGKTDVTQSELEQLINAVVGMAEASKASSKPMTTASFLQQLTQPKQPIEKVEAPMAVLQNVFQAPVESIPLAATTNMEGLSDSDLQTLLQNFKDLCTDEQHSLISYLKKLEAREPERVERLRKFVNLEAQSVVAERDNEALFEKSDDEISGKVSPFAGRFAETNPTSDDTLQNKIERSDKPRIIDRVTIDSDDEEYTFEDVFKAADKNIRDKKEKEEQERLAKTSSDFKHEGFDLSNAKSIIANIMGQFRNKTEVESTPNSVTPTSIPATSVSIPITTASVSVMPALHPVIHAVTTLKPAVIPPPKPPSVPMPTSFSNTNFFDNIPINITNLTNALNTVHQIKENPPQLQPLLNRNTLSPQLRPPNINNTNLNSFSSQTRSHPVNQSFQPRHTIPDTQQNLQRPHFEPPPARQNQHLSNDMNPYFEPPQSIQQTQKPQLFRGNNPNSHFEPPAAQRNQFPGQFRGNNDSNPYFESPVPQRVQPGGTAPFRGGFNRAPHPLNQLERKQNYFDDDDYENRW